MIDLDILEALKTSASAEGTELYCRFGVLLVSGRLSYQDWDKCVRALAIHKYILPDARYINEILLDTVYHRFRKSPTMLLWYALLMGHIESHYTETEQARILGIIIREPHIKWKNRPLAR